MNDRLTRLDGGMVDTADLKSADESRAGSSPALAINLTNFEKEDR